MTDQEIESLEQEAENTRTRVSGLLDELRGRVSPGEMVDQMVSYAGEGAGEFVRTLGNQLRKNPLPAVLIGVGVAWLMFSDRRPPGARVPARGPGERPAASASESVDHVRGVVAAASDRAASVFDEISDSATRAADSASDFAHRAADGTSAIRHRAAEAALHARYTAEDLGKRSLDTAHQILHEQPLVAAGIGLAIGAAIGAALPATEAENRLMGAASDEIRDGAREAAAEEYERVKHAAADVYGTVADTVAREASTHGADDEWEFAEHHTPDHGSRRPAG